jgi:glyoxylate utilization-related uncharacterized protein
MNSTKWIVAAALAVVAAVPGAQQPGFTRALLQDQPLSTSGYVVEGTLELLIEGQPPKTLKAGEVFFVPAGVVHDGRNVGSGKAVVLATYIVETGKPVASPAK